MNDNDSAAAPEDPGGASPSASTPPNPVLRGGMIRMLNVTITSLERDAVVAQMLITPDHLNYNGHVNGGALMAFADLLGAAGAAANRPPGYRGGTLESKTNFFAAAKGSVIHGVSVPLHQGRSTSVWQTTLKDADGRMVAMVTQTQISMAIKGE